MKSIFIYLLFTICCLPTVFSQTLAEAKELYLKKEYTKALPVFEAEYKLKPDDANLNHWYGVCLFETGGDIKKAEKCLLEASKKKIQDSFLYLGQIYTREYNFTQAKEAFGKYELLLKKKDDVAKAHLQEKRKVMARLNRMVSNTEDVQIIDSVIVDKDQFLSAYNLSLSSGRLDYFDKVFTTNMPVESTVYFNEKGSKIYYAQPNKENVYSLFSMEKLLKEYTNEKQLSANNFGLLGDVNYPYIMPDGVTIYFAAKDAESLGGYDLFVSRYNMNNDTYLAPERLNMPFNSLYNDYMMAIDEEKGIGWFASDRYMEDGDVCIYTFLPNKTVKAVESEDESYLANRARISSIKGTWVAGQNYSKLIALARKSPEARVEVVRDFEFVINDNYTYYRLIDFKNKNARDIYYKVIQLKSEEKSLLDKLEKQRVAYSNTSSEDGRRRMSGDILDMERKYEQIQAEIPELEIQARNQEIQFLK